jgi:hypothetical protein
LASVFWALWKVCIYLPSVRPDVLKTDVPCLPTFAATDLSCSRTSYLRALREEQTHRNILHLAGIREYSGVF